MKKNKFHYYEFFAGGGMARLGLGKEWQSIFANDICKKKTQAYKINFPPGEEYICKDIRLLDSNELPGNPVMAWASFPCQDLSLAGTRMGLNGERSSTFWPFWKLMQKLDTENRSPEIIVLENVVGAITSHKGLDFQIIVRSLIEEGYMVGPLVVNSICFLPQSRPRLFIVAIKNNFPVGSGHISSTPIEAWHSKNLITAYNRLSLELKDKWVWWNLPEPAPMNKELHEFLEMDSEDIEWFPKEKTDHLINLMSAFNLKKIKEAQKSGLLKVGTIYRRTRVEKGIRFQRAEVRVDQISGCIRTPAGGSSRQILIFVEGKKIKARLFTPREVANLMGIPSRYNLPENYNQAYHLMGDGLVVPVVSWLDKKLLSPLAKLVVNNISKAA
ncbi:DNA cytosine methyltransferase [Nitrospina watsonii]|uniref:DNA (cytosine-5-)-methyltransferase n=1 Tax=Nitrospina watsonii TaxID=1323948 RepID=A0ABM9HFB2_9BACT|nr:DNA cytosine methyltransferase [Nitrospina watsonii]CAI2718935.1 DNA (cytosine-5-)-methyltransferase [Nitrospina watsonii]